MINKNKKPVVEAEAPKTEKVEQPTEVWND
jgi:hypothetical protein